MSYRTDQYEGMLAETLVIPGANGDPIYAYHARPLGPGPYPAVVLIHHMPGWDTWYKEATRKFASRGYAAIAPDLYCRVAQGSPEDVGANVRAEGGCPRTTRCGDVTACAGFLRCSPYSNGRVGVFGTSSAAAMPTSRLRLRTPSMRSTTSGAVEWSMRPKTY